MANKKNEPASKARSKKANIPGNVPPTAKEQKENKEPKGVTVVDATGVMKQLQNKNGAGLDVNHQVDLLKMSHDIFGLDPDAKQKYGEDLVNSMNLATATGVVVTMATVAITENTPFAATIRANCLPAILEAGKNLGINIDQKMLPAPNKDGNITVPAAAIEVKEETAEKIKKEQAVATGEIPELDPEKVVELGEEALKAALTYLAVNKKGNLFQAYVDLYNFYRTYTLALARKAENAEEATAKFEAYTPADWFTSVFEKIEPTLLIGGIGKGMCTLTAVEGSPVHAYCVLRGTSKKEKATVPTFSDTELADIAKAFMKAVANSELNGIKEGSNKRKGLYERRDEAKANKDQKGFDDACAIIDMFHKTLDIIANPNFDTVESLLEKVAADETHAKVIYKNVVNSFYEGTKCVDKDGKVSDFSIKKHYKNLDENVKQYVGIITNMFADPMNRVTAYSENNIHELEEYSEEEWKAVQKEALAKKHSKNSEGEGDNAQ